MNKNGYVVFDFYENVEKLGKVANMKQAEQLERQRYEDTDGECEVRVYDLDNLKDMHELISDIVFALGL